MLTQPAISPNPQSNEAVLQQPQEISTTFIELLLRDSEEMGSEKLNNLSKMTMLTLLLSTNTHL